MVDIEYWVSYDVSHWNMLPRFTWFKVVFCSSLSDS